MLPEKYTLGFFPTPLQRLENLSKKYSDYNLFIKRDDNTGLASGGNKTRKLQYFIHDVLEKGCDTVITAGAQQSNHCRQTAAACAKAGLECHLMVRGTKPKTYQGNLLLSHLLGAKIHFEGSVRKEVDYESLKKTIDTQGKKTYIIPIGGSNITGALGFAWAIKEVKEQLKEMDVKMDYVFFASSSGGTQAGLVLGMELYGLETELVPIKIDKDDAIGKGLEEVVLDIVKDGVQLLSLNKEYTISDVEVNKNYNQEEYGVLTDKEKYAIATLAKNEGILLDPVYTGRAFYGMLDCLKNNKIKLNSNILFWHTGGLPALFGYADGLK